MNYKDFNLGDWIGHISGVIEDESELDGNEMRDLVEFLTTLNPCADAVSRQAVLDEINRYIEKAQSTGTKDDFISFSELVVKELPPVNPQNDVFDKIRAEVEEQIERDFAFAKTEEVKVPVHYGTANGLQVAARIIDKYRKGDKE